MKIEAKKKRICFLSSPETKAVPSSHFVVEPLVTKNCNDWMTILEIPITKPHILKIYK